jgi:hypothetical protein
MQHFGWHTEIFLEFNTYVEQEVGSHMRQVHHQYRVAWFVVIDDFISMHF